MTPLQSRVQLLGVVLVFVIFGLLEISTGRWRKPLATSQDRIVEIGIFILGPFSVVAAVNVLVTGALSHFAPHLQGACSQLPVWAMVLALLLGDDLTQYFWHRLSHTSVLWPLHRSHHAAPYMGVRVVYRNNLFYYLLMPGLWVASVWLYLGFGWVYIFYTIFKMSVIVGAHCEWRWDDLLYRYRWLHPLAWIIERTVSTPHTHYAHHALTQDDGIGHYAGNYGNLLFLWDVIFGTARITRRLPPDFGLQEDREQGAPNALVQLFWPLLRDNRSAQPPES